MNSAPSSSAADNPTFAKRVAVPNIVPALPRIPLPLKRENTPPAKSATAAPLSATSGSSTAFSDVTQLANGVTRLRLDAGLAKGTALPAEDVAVRAGRERQTIATRGPIKDASDPSRPGLLSDGSNKEVVRYPAVPMSHEVSQSSKLKERTTITVGEDTVQIQTHNLDDTPEQAAERALHSGFMREALDMARLALKTNETPVGCVLVWENRVVARGMNATNISRNGTRHAELMAICALLSYSPASDTEPAKRRPTVKTNGMPLGSRTNQSQPYEETSTWGDVDPRDGHLYPYGQKLHPSPRVDRSVISECTLYVTVEPCVMCASLLRQLGIKKVYFGAVNDKFGGTGGVFRIHQNSPYTMASAPPSPVPQNGKSIARPPVERRPASANPITDVSSGDEKDECPAAPPVGASPAGASPPGDGGNVERGYEVEGGWGRDEAVNLLRQFYVQENGRAPVPRKKEGRAARLAAMMGQTDDKAQENGDNETSGESAPMTPSENTPPAAAVDSEITLDRL
ncbi:hypothetical protein OQA88_4535 [Cercophora sp. LCS_1]